jgi:adenosylmethionine-8-amino-7-oxononanoate aminotransferase
MMFSFVVAATRWFFSPPLIISENQIEMVFATIRRALDTID